MVMPIKTVSATPARGETLAEIGRRARVEAQKKALLATLQRLDWSLSDTASELGLSNASNVIRAIRDLGLGVEYQAAIDAGKVRRGIR